jgi:hypothetical protein
VRCGEHGLWRFIGNVSIQTIQRPSTVQSSGRQHAAQLNVSVRQLVVLRAWTQTATLLRWKMAAICSATASSHANGRCSRSVTSKSVTEVEAQPTLAMGVLSTGEACLKRHTHRWPTRCGTIHAWCVHGARDIGGVCVLPHALGCRMCISATATAMVMTQFGTQSRCCDRLRAGLEFLEATTNDDFSHGLSVNFKSPFMVVSSGVMLLGFLAKLAHDGFVTSDGHCVKVMAWRLPTNANFSTTTGGLAHKGMIYSRQGAIIHKCRHLCTGVK